MKALLIGFAAITLACAGRHHEEALNTWLGSDVNRLIEAWGPPSNTYELPNGEKMYSWYYDGGVVAVPINGVVFARHKNCQTTFTVSKAGTVETWRYQGNAC
jgi:hypothetical protein